MREVIRDRERLEHIVDAINRILNYCEGKSKEDLELNSLQFYGVVKNIEIIGEASYKLTSSFRSAHPETPWDAISKMRHVLVHEYYQIDEDQVWNVIHSDLHILKNQIIGYISDTDWETWNKNEIALSESVVHKRLIQTASRMKIDGFDVQQISRYTGLNIEEIEDI